MKDEFIAQSRKLPKANRQDADRRCKQDTRQSPVLYKNKGQNKIYNAL